jgi:hypothetical protein
MAQAQAQEYYGGATQAVARAISYLVDEDLIGKIAFRGRKVLHLKARGARILSGRPDAEGVRSHPERETDLLVALA